MSKACSKCGVSKSLDEFPKNRDAKDGRNSVCTCCKKLQHKEYMARPEVLARSRAYQASYRKNNPDKARSWHLRTEYNMTTQDYSSMLETQQGKCAICQAASNDLHVDHCHSTGKIRGLLCQACNTGLGKFMDREDLLLKAVSYLKESKH